MHVYECINKQEINDSTWMNVRDIVRCNVEIQTKTKTVAKQ